MTDDLRPAAASSPPPRPATSSSVRRLPELTRTAMWTAVAVITVLTAVAMIALWWPATAGLTGADLVKARLDALKIGLSIGVGSGGVVALYLAWRRQHRLSAHEPHHSGRSRMSAKVTTYHRSTRPVR